jgi:hypothetical protein
MRRRKENDEKSGDVYGTFVGLVYSCVYVVRGVLMRRLLLDTNIYGEMVLDSEFFKIKENIPKKAIIHGFKVVRNELRDVPLQLKIGKKNMRIALLHIYDEIIKKSYGLTVDINDLANSYFEEYKKLGGSQAHDKMFNDFCVVACASIHKVDIVVSEDSKSMLVENALQAYKTINISKSIRTPEFIGYLEFKRWLSE